MATTPVAGGSQLSPDQLNMVQRQILTSQAIKVKQQVFTGQINPLANQTITIQPRPVGVLLRFIVQIDGTANNTGAGTATLNDMGLAPVLSNVQFTDITNITRINTDGIHLSMLANVKRGYPFASTADFNKNSGNNVSQVFNVNPAAWPVLIAPATIATATQGTFRTFYEIPIAYSDSDTRGAIFTNVLNATVNLQLTFGTLFNGGGTNDNTQSVYTGQTGTFPSATVTVYQEYYDQLPMGQGGAILPWKDISTIYELKNTTAANIAVNQEVQVPFVNFRDFFSMAFLYNNNGLSTGRTTGSDMNYMALQSASSYNLWKMTPYEAMRTMRDINMEDTPNGLYYFSFRNRPISTTQYGNMQFVFNPLSYTAGGYGKIYWEDMGLESVLTKAGSLVG